MMGTISVFVAHKYLDLFILKCIAIFEVFVPNKVNRFYYQDLLRCPHFLGNKRMVNVNVINKTITYDSKNRLLRAHLILVTTSM